MSSLALILPSPGHVILLNSSLKSSAHYSEMPWIVIQESLKREWAKGSLKNSNRYHLLGDILVFQKNALSALVRSLSIF